MARRATIGEAAVTLVVAWFLFDLIRWMFWPKQKARVRSTSATDDVQSQLGDETAAQQWEDDERRRWASALGISAASVDFSVIEEIARDNGGPDDWSRRGWTTPCGPPEDPTQYCPSDMAVSFEERMAQVRAAEEADYDASLPSSIG